MAFPFLGALGGIASSLGGLAGSALANPVVQAGLGQGANIGINYLARKFLGDDQQRPTPGTTLLEQLQQQQPSMAQVGFEPFAQQAREAFSQQTVPGIAERFTGLGGQRSSAFGQQLGQAARGLESDIAGQRAQWQRGQQQLGLQERGQDLQRQQQLANYLLGRGGLGLQRQQQQQAGGLGALGQLTGLLSGQQGLAQQAMGTRANLLGQLANLGLGQQVQNIYQPGAASAFQSGLGGALGGLARVLTQWGLGGL
jgi:hypothetical protein